MNWTKRIIYLVGAVMLIVTEPVAAQSPSCAAKANAIAARNGGRVLSVSTIGRGAAAKCRITILVKSRNGGPARKRTIIVRK